MLILRLFLILLALLLVVTAGFYFFTRDPRYLNFAWQTLRFALLMVLLFVLLFIAERYVLVGWRLLL